MFDEDFLAGQRAANADLALRRERAYGYALALYVAQDAADDESGEPVGGDAVVSAMTEAMITIFGEGITKWAIEQAGKTANG